MLTINLSEDEVQTVARAEVDPEERMSETEARQKLGDVIVHLEQADCIFQKEVKSHLDQAISIMLDIDAGQGWNNLGYRAIRHLIKAEREPRFRLSGSQFYRRFSAAKVRKGVSQIWSNVDTAPMSQLNELRKLPCEQVGRCFVGNYITSPQPKSYYQTRQKNCGEPSSNSNKRG